MAAFHFQVVILTCMYVMLVDLGGSLAVASKGLFSTGVSTDLNGMSSVFVYRSCGRSLSLPSDLPPLGGQGGG